MTLTDLIERVEKAMSWLSNWWICNGDLAADEARRGRELSVARDLRDYAYAERNKVVAALAKLFPSGTARTAIEGWDPEWHGCVYIDLPTGQVSWHYQDAEAHLFASLPAYTKPWDGHDTAEKYRRLAALSTKGGKT